MSLNQMERTKELILEMQQGAVDWNLQKIKAIIGGRRSRKSPWLYDEFLELLNNGGVTVSVDRINYETKESLEEAQVHPDYIPMFRRLNDNLTEFGLLLYFSVCKWLIKRGELPKGISSPTSLSHLATDTSSFSVTMRNASIYQMLYFIFPIYRCHVHVVYTNEEIILFQFEITEKYMEWKCIKDKEIVDSISGNMERFFAKYPYRAD
ncbi:hypothetical protein bcgnr5378_06810 [Bacillus cereus]|uniref:Uncharacterized protein n=1 Tax=Bacillus cereus TaxID=1396 RepID=A0A164NWM7_BACCE|nr:hypothetical protein [Bacillus cereus]KZD65939.1 hypothetical protein B4088_2696 [Bacillus cereus]